MTDDHALMAAFLPGQHRDPFDRMLAAQAVIEDLTLITRDPQLAGFGCRLLWSTRNGRPGQSSRSLPPRAGRGDAGDRGGSGGRARLHQRRAVASPARRSRRRCRGGRSARDEVARGARLRRRRGAAAAPPQCRRCTRRGAPADEIARAVFDAAEQARVEALGARAHGRGARQSRRG